MIGYAASPQRGPVPERITQAVGEECERGMAAMTEAGPAEVRAINPEELEAFGFVASTALALYGPGGIDTAHVRPEWTTCVFEAGELATTFAAWPFSMRYGGNRLAVAGVTMVGTLPNKRRRGYLRRAMERSFVEQRERGQSIAILYASMAAIYQRFGYAVASTHYHYAIDPRDVRFALEDAPPGSVTVREASLDDAAKGGPLDLVYRAYAEPRTLMLHRGRALWETGALERPKEPDGPNFVAFYEEDGELQGYVIYVNRPHFRHMYDRDQLLTVKDMAWTTPRAYVALWQHLGAHDLVYRIEQPRAAEDDPAFRLLEEPRRLRRTGRDGILLRVVDVEAALAGRPYGEAGAFTFELTDALCEWNRGIWRLETDGRESRVTRSAEAPALHLTAHALGAMIAGYLPPSRLAEMGRIEAARPEELGAWNRAFATRHRPFCADAF